MQCDVTVDNMAARDWRQFDLLTSHIHHRDKGGGKNRADDVINYVMTSLSLIRKTNFILVPCKTYLIIILSPLLLFPYYF